jgi:transcriptional regulator with XRE-family HTH domain
MAKIDSSARRKEEGATPVALVTRHQDARVLIARIRTMRRARGWSLSVLSERSKIATSTLSKIENNSLSLTYDRLCAIAEAFEMSLSEFLAGPEESAHADGASARFVLERRGAGERVDTPGYLYEYLCTGLRSKQIVPTLSKVKARTLQEFGPLLKHPGEEFVFVIKGKVEVHTEVYSPEKLEAGDSLYLDSRMGHAYLNAAEGETLILSAMYQPNEAHK